MLGVTSHESPAGAPPVSEPLQHPFSWRFATPLFLGSALNPVNSSLIATALVPIARGLGVSIGQTAALVTALYLASAVAQPTAGKAAEVFGPRRVFLAGIVHVAAGGLAGGFAQGLPALLAGRVLIGLGTSCAYPTAMLLIRRRATEAGLAKPPGRVLGGLQIAGAATGSLGLPLGWRAVFFVNVPVALLALAATLAWGPPDGPLAGARRPRDVAARLDVIGIAGFAAAMIALLLFLFDLPTASWDLLAVSAAGWIGLGWWELRAGSPFLDFRLLAGNRALTSTYLRFGLVSLLMYVVIYGVTQWNEIVRGLPESEAGLVLLPMTVLSGLVVLPISRRNLVRGPVIASALACLIGSAGVLLLDASAWLGWMVLVTVVFGLGLGAAAAGNQTALYDQAPAEQLGTAAGLLRTFGQLGSIGAAAVTGLVFRTHVSDHGLHRIAWIMIGVSVAVVAMTVLDRTLRTRPATPDGSGPRRRAES